MNHGARIVRNIISETLLIAKQAKQISELPTSFGARIC